MSKAPISYSPSAARTRSYVQTLYMPKPAPKPAPVLTILGEICLAIGAAICLCGVIALALALSS